MADSGEGRDRSRDALTVLFELSQRLTGGVPLEAALSDVATAAATVVSADHSSVLLLDESRSSLLCRAVHGFSETEAAQITFAIGEGIAGWVAQEGEPVCLEDAAADPRFKDLGMGREVHALCCVPLTTPSGVIGVITASREGTSGFDAEDERLLQFLAASVVKDVENARLYRLAVTDGLTRAYNRQFLSERLPEEMERHRRYGQSLAVVLVDLDHFKSVNDRFGHAAGDTVLQRLVTLAREVVREVDLVVRYGGEEFLLILPNTGSEGGWRVADRLRLRLSGEGIATGAGEVRVTLSAGVAQLRDDDREPTELIARADAALYEAKAGGRNRVVTAPG